MDSQRGNKSRIAFTAFFITGTLLLFSCTKTIEQVPVVHIPQELKDYTFFNPGSYWIYEDSISHAQDTIRVTSFMFDSSLTTNGYYNVPGPYYTVYVAVGYSDVNSPLYSNINTHNFSYNCIYNTYPTSVRGNLFGPINVGDPANNSEMFYPFNSSYQIDSYYGNDVPFYDTVKFVKKISNYSINGFTFPEAVEFSESKQVTGYDGYGDDIVQPAYHYYARGVGLIQFLLIDSNKNYKLVKYHVQ